MPQPPPPDDAPPRKCKYKPSLFVDYACPHEATPGQDFCIAHRDDRTPDEEIEFEALIDRMLHDKDYGFVGFCFPKGFDRFGGHHFEGDVHFVGASFAGDASFWNSHIGGGAYFWDAHIAGDAMFWDARIGGHAHLHDARIDGEADFSDARIDGEADFSEARIGRKAGFDRAHIGGDASFWSTGFGGLVDFTDTIFNADVDFHGAALPPAGDFGDPRQANTPRKDRKGVPFRGPFSVRPGEGESICRFAKQVCQNMGEYDTAGDWHYRERWHRWYARKSAGLAGTYFRLRHQGTGRLLAQATVRLRAWLRGCLEQVFGQWVFGYGEKPLRVLRVGAVVILGCWVLYGLGRGALEHTAAPSAVTAFGDVLYEPRLMTWPDALYFSVVTFTTLGFGDWHPRSFWPMGLLTMFEALAGAFLMALFVVSLARRWGRG